MFEIQPYPAWKQMYQVITPQLPEKTEWSYEELSAIAGSDIKTTGRGQFYRFRREVLKNMSLWFEVMSKRGYTVIPAKDHTGAAVKRVKQARRKVVLARAINGLVRMDELTPEQRALQSMTAALLHSLSTDFNRVGRQLAAAGKRIEQGLGPKLLDDGKDQKAG